MPLDTSIPPWLQKAWQPHEQEKGDPGRGMAVASQVLGWMKYGSDQKALAQTLPLEVKQRELQNKQMELNNQLRTIDVDNAEAEHAVTVAETPKWQEMNKLWATTPGGAVATGPGIWDSQEYTKRANERLLQDQRTEAGWTIHQRNLEDIKAAADIFAKNGPYIEPEANGLYDHQKLMDGQAKVREMAFQDAARKARLADPALNYAQDIGGLQSELRMNEKAMQGMPADSIEMEQMTERSLRLKDEIKAMEDKLPYGHTGTHLTAAAANLKTRQDLKAEIDDLEEAGDFETADSRRDDLKNFDSAHPDAKQHAQYTAINATLREIERKLGDRMMKSEWPKLRARRASLQRTIGLNPDQEDLDAEAALRNEPAAKTPPGSKTIGGTTKYRWTPQGTVPY